MTDITTTRDCGNSPKQQLLQSLVVAVARADVHRLLELVTDDVQWQPVGRHPIAGATAVCAALTRGGPATRLTIEHVVSHGKAGAVNGVVEYGRKRRAFCFVFAFASAKGGVVREITSYSIPLD